MNDREADQLERYKEKEREREQCGGAERAKPADRGPPQRSRSRSDGGGSASRRGRKRSIPSDRGSTRGSESPFGAEQRVPQTRCRFYGNEMGMCFKLSVNSCIHHHGEWDKKQWHDGPYVLSPAEFERAKAEVKRTFEPIWQENFGKIIYDKRGMPTRDGIEEFKKKGKGQKPGRDDYNAGGASPGKHRGGKAGADKSAAPKKGGDWRGTAGDNDWAPDQRRDWRDRGDWDRSWEKWRDNRW